MKLINSTDFPDHFLRRMVAWCCKQIDCSPKILSGATFRNRSHGAYSGRAWGSAGRIVVRIGQEEEELLFRSGRVVTAGGLLERKKEKRARKPISHVARQPAWHG